MCRHCEWSVCAMAGGASIICSFFVHIALFCFCSCFLSSKIPYTNHYVQIALFFFSVVLFVRSLLLRCHYCHAVMHHCRNRRDVIKCSIEQYGIRENGKRTQEKRDEIPREPTISGQYNTVQYVATSMLLKEI